jgi:hypothetical protein
MSGAAQVEHIIAAVHADYGRVDALINKTAQGR